MPQGNEIDLSRFRCRTFCLGMHARICYHICRYMVREAFRPGFPLFKYIPQAMLETLVFKGSQRREHVIKFASYSPQEHIHMINHVTRYYFRDCTMLLHYSLSIQITNYG